MSQKIKKVKILTRADTQENWKKINPILEKQEIGYETQNGMYKIGDGITRWNDLSYALSNFARKSQMPAVFSGNQSGVAIGDTREVQVESEQDDEGNIIDNVITGNKNTAAYSTSIGSLNEVNGAYSVALGYDNNIKGIYSISGGRNNTSTGAASICLGQGNEAKATTAIATGYNTKAHGLYSASFGNRCKAIGTASMAAGLMSEASAIYSFALGAGIIANYYCGTAVGRYNNSDEDTIAKKPLFIVGNGLTEDERSNAFMVGLDGTIYGSKSTVSSDPDNVLVTKDFAETIIIKTTLVSTNWKIWIETGENYYYDLSTINSSNISTVDKFIEVNLDIEKASSEQILSYYKAEFFGTENNYLVANSTSWKPEMDIPIIIKMTNIGKFYDFSTTNNNENGSENNVNS